MKIWYLSVSDIRQIHKPERFNPPKLNKQAQFCPLTLNQKKLIECRSYTVIAVQDS